MPTNESHIRPLAADPAPGMARDSTSFDNVTPRQFAGSLPDKTETELEEILGALEDELRHGNAGSSTRRDLDEVVWELNRREMARRTQERRRANIDASRQANVESMADKPGVWVQGRPLDERERKDLATFIRWVMADKNGEQP
jgi:hypothetical protein